MRRTAVAALSAALLLAAVPPARGADQPPVEIDVILSMAGPLTFLGQAEYATLGALETNVNRRGGIRGRPVHFVFHDDKSEPQVAVQLVNAVLAKHPAIFLGSTSAASCLAMAPLVASGPVEFCLSPSIHPARGGFVFSASVDVRDCWIALIRYFRERGLTRIAILTGTDLAGRDADVSLATALDLPENKDRGITIVSHQHFNPTDLTVAAQIAQIKAANPQAAILWAAGTPFATLLRGAAEAGLDVPIGASNANLTYVQMKQYASFLPKELVFPGLPFLARQASSRRAREVQAQFFEVCAAAGIRPDFLYNFAWDPGMIAIDAFRALGTGATTEQVRSYIAGLHGYTGLSGDYDFRDGSQRGLTERNITLMRWDTGKETWDAVSRPGGMPLR